MALRVASNKAVATRSVQTRAVVRPVAALQQQHKVQAAVALGAAALVAAAPVSV
jgi:hypothetical protein